MKYTTTYNSKASIQVLENEIHKMSNLIHRDTLKGGADTVRVNLDTYFKYIVPIVDHIHPRYTIISNQETEMDVVFVEFSDEIKHSGEIKII
jgi:hypothetical protein